MADQPIVEPLRAVANSDPDKSVRDAAQQALARLERPQPQGPVATAESGPHRSPLSTSTVAPYASAPTALFCPSCGKQIPGNSAFCLHCGGRVPVLGVTPEVIAPGPVEWEYQDSVYQWESPRPWVYAGHQRGTIGYTVSQARQAFWENSQREIRSALQKFLDEGWEPVDPVGPESIEVRHFKGIRGQSLFGAWWTGLQEARDWHLEAVEFRLQMRRPKRQEPG